MTTRDNQLRRSAQELGDFVLARANASINSLTNGHAAYLDRQRELIERVNKLYDLLESCYKIDWRKSV